MNKYQKEKEHFIVFRNLVNNFPSGEIWHDDRPDFLIHAANGIIGIEHCLVHIPTQQNTPLQAIESQTDEIVSIAKEHAELRGMPPILANFVFRYKENMDRSSRIDMARDIARFIFNEITHDITPRTRIELLYPDLDDPLLSIHIYTLEKDSKHLWKNARAGWAMENCIELFQEAISKKDKLIKSYLVRCNNCWLLMVGEIKPSSFIHPNENTINHKYSTSFNRIYYLDLSLMRLHEMKTVAI